MTSTLFGATILANAATAGLASNATTLGTSRESAREYNPIEEPTSIAILPGGTISRNTRISRSPFSRQ
ncbi:MAG: hypothetical protein ABSC37_10525 [Xanthobacteraceae bacterium]